MSVAHDTATRFPADATATVVDTTAGNRTFSHTAAAGANGAVVIVLSNADTAQFTGVLYGGTTMDLVASAVDTSEPGHVDIYFLNLGGLSLGGTQTVTLQGCTTTAKVAYCHTCTSTTGYTALDSTITKDTTTATNPTATIAAVVANAMVYGGIAGGTGAPANYVPGTGEEVFTGGTGAGIGADFGANSGHVARSTAVTSAGAYTINWTWGTSDDYCIAAVSIKDGIPPTVTSVARVSLQGGTDPAVDTGHSIKARVRKTSGTGVVKFNAALYEGASNRSGDLTTSALTTSLAEYTLTIPDASAANITDYSNLELRFWGSASTGDTIDVEVADIWLEIPGVVLATIPDLTMAPMRR